jgi:hypothetical protein
MLSRCELQELAKNGGLLESARPQRKDHVSWLWILIIVVLVLLVLGFFGRGRYSR